jgi:hypothetical protein
MKRTTSRQIQECLLIWSSGRQFSRFYSNIWKDNLKNLSMITELISQPEKISPFITKGRGELINKLKILKELKGIKNGRLKCGNN